MGTFKVFTDGASRGNPGPASIGVAIYDEEASEIHSISKYIGTQTNNQAEYRAVLEAFKFLSARPHEFKKVLLLSDSQLMVRQMTGVYKIKNPELKEIYIEIKELISVFEKVDFLHIPREENRRADELANIALDSSGY